MQLTKNILCSTLLLLCTSAGIAQNQSLPKTLPFLKDFTTYWYYYNESTNLSNEFIPLDESKKEIKKIVFLQHLLNGKYIPVRVLINNKVHYQLYGIDAKISEEIKQVIKQMAEIEIKNLMYEGKKIPDFNFTDLEGKKYNDKNTKGKVIVMKLWFIGCKVCIQEMPQLNELVQKYSNRNDIIFLSLALDKPQKLKAFLHKTTFKYAVVPDKEKYIYENLQINEFPTHIIVNRKGIIVKVFSSAKFLPNVLSNTLK